MIFAYLAFAPTALLAWRPFLDPIDVTGYRLWLMLPLILVVAVVYKAIKIDDLRKLPKQATVLFLQIFAFMVLALIALWLLTEIA
ncbi:MAG: hypothetical protein ACOC1G_06475 [Phycisphaeraceae bacterium]